MRSAAHREALRRPKHRVGEWLPSWRAAVPTYNVTRAVDLPLLPARLHTQRSAPACVTNMSTVVHGRVHSVRPLDTSFALGSRDLWTPSLPPVLDPIDAQRRRTYIRLHILRPPAPAP